MIAQEAMQMGFIYNWWLMKRIRELINFIMVAVFGFQCSTYSTYNFGGISDVFL